MAKRQPVNTMPNPKLRPTKGDYWTRISRKKVIGKLIQIGYTNGPVDTGIAFASNFDGIDIFVLKPKPHLVHVDEPNQVISINAIPTVVENFLTGRNLSV